MKCNPIAYIIVCFISLNNCNSPERGGSEQSARTSQSNDTAPRLGKKNSEGVRDSNISKRQFNSLFDTLTITKLPIGYPNFFSEKIGALPRRKEVSSDVLDELYKPFFQLNYNKKISSDSQLNSFYKLDNDYNYDFDKPITNPIDSTKFDGRGQYFNYQNRIPNVGSNKILIFNAIDKLEGTSILDLAVVDSTNKVIDRLNLSHFYRYTISPDEEVIDFIKYYYLDKDNFIYLIFIRQYPIKENSVVKIYDTVKYKILSTGRIVRWFDQKEGKYESEIESGNVKNHLKDGEWEERYGYIYRTVADLNYKDGVIINDVIEFYELDGDRVSNNPVLTINPKIGKIVR